MWMSQSPTKPLLCTWAIITRYTVTFILLALLTISQFEKFDLNSQLNVKTRVKKNKANRSGLARYKIFTEPLTPV